MVQSGRYTPRHGAAFAFGRYGGSEPGAGSARHAQATRQAFTGFYGGLATVKALEAAEKSSATAVESSKLGYNVGTLINIDVLIALDTLFTTRASLYKARYDTIMNALRLKAQAANLSDEDLIAINALLR